MSSLYDISVKHIDGKPATLGEHRGEVLLVVNVASACGLTVQYAALEKLHETYKAKGFSVLGFPANEFAGQEPGTNAEIAEFCTTKFGVRFPMYEKIVVKGEGQHPLYQKLTTSGLKAQGPAESALRKTLDQHGLGPKNDTDVMWNFEKYLVNRKGEIVARFQPDVTPDDPLVTKAVEAELAKA